MSAQLAPAWAVVVYAFRESLRRRVFVVVLVLTLGFLALYGVGAHFAFRDARGFAGHGPRILDPTAFTGATIFGLGMFASLFLGSVLAVFLTLGVVRGDAESGLLQPIVARPIGRGVTLAARFAGAAVAAAAYELIVYAVAVILIDAIGGWTPDHLAGPGLGLALAVIVMAALSLLGSVFLAATAQGIALFMVFGAGLAAGLLGQIGKALNSHSLHVISHDISWALPFEAIYQAGLHALTSQTPGLTGVVIRLGPFGGAEAAGPGLALWCLAYAAAVVGIAIVLFARRDL